MSNTYNALIHAKQDGTGEEVANNLSGGGGSDVSHEVEAMLNVYGSKNLLVYPYEDTTKVENGITYTDIGNGIVNINGTASGESIFVFNSTLKLAKGTYIVSTEDAIPSNVDAVIQIYNTSYSVFVSFGTNAKEATFTLSQNETLVVRFKVNSGYTLSNFVLKLMIRDARITDNTFVPYAMTNRELTENVEELNSNKLDLDNITDFSGYTSFANSYIVPKDGIICITINSVASNHCVAGLKDGVPVIDAYGTASGTTVFSFPVKKGQGICAVTNTGTGNTFYYYPFK